MFYFITILSLIFIGIIYCFFTKKNSDSLKKILPILLFVIALVAGAWQWDYTKLTSQLDDNLSETNSFSKEFEELKEDYDSLSKDLEEQKDLKDYQHKYKKLKKENDDLEKDIEKLTQSNEDKDIQLQENSSVSSTQESPPQNTETYDDDEIIDYQDEEIYEDYNESYIEEADQPDGDCDIKGSETGIYHVPGSRYYNQTKNVADWFCTPEEAVKAGYRAPLQ